jgi:hypothetical protein
MSDSLSIRDILAEDPTANPIPNEGVADVDQEDTIVWELQKFVCEGQFDEGLKRILGAYLRNQGKAQQPGVWVSGFYGSGKSHLVKILRYLWTDETFSSGASARGLAQLTTQVEDDLRELSTLAARTGGLHAAAGKLQGALPIRRGLLAMLFRSVGIPEEYPIATFSIWMRDNGILDAVAQHVTQTGKDFSRELRNMYVSPVLAEALIKAMPDFASDAKDARQFLRAQYPQLPPDQDITDEQMVTTIRDLLAPRGQMPCTLVVIDELQQYIGDRTNRAIEVQEVTEACTKQFGDRMLFVGTGQSALPATSELQKLQARYTIPIELTDRDVDRVVRRLVLAKKPDRAKAIEDMLSRCSGEIDRHLVDTEIGPRQEDKQALVADYPLLPVRRRFWERTLRAVDRAGTAAQLRTQLRIAYEAVSAMVELPLAAVVPADFIYNQISITLLQSGVLLRDIHERIEHHHNDAAADGTLKARICALCFLISQLPREPGSDTGVRATPEMLADLLVDNLEAGNTALRKKVPELLTELEKQGDLMRVGDEYSMQTREGAEWNREFQAQYSAIVGDAGRIATERNQLLRARCTEQLKGIKLLHGASKAPRNIELHFGDDEPKAGSDAVPVWIRDGWSDSEKNVLADARKAGQQSPTVFVFLPAHASEALRDWIAHWQAAKATLDLRGVPTTDEGTAARSAMDTRFNDAERRVKHLIGEVLDGAEVYQGGGGEVGGLAVSSKVEAAAVTALARLYPEFSIADDPGWEKVVTRAKQGGGDCLAAVKHTGEIADSPVCKAILGSMGAGKKGKDIRSQFGGPPYGWPRDAIDGALLALMVGDLVSASQNGTRLSVKDLDQGKIGVADFRPVNVQFTTTQRIGVRTLLQVAGIPYKTNEEGAAVVALLDRMLALACAAGDEPPAPAKPSAAYLDELTRETGNEQCVAVYEARERITTDLADWQKRADGIAARMPRWEALRRLIAHAADLPVVDEVQPQMDAILKDRLLLAEPDPVPPLCERVGGALRDAVNVAFSAYQQRHTDGMAALDASADWQQLDENQKADIIARCALQPADQPDVSTEQALLQSLDAISLDDWTSRTDALTQRFQNALVEATRLLRPEAVRAKLPSRTLSTRDEVDAWLDEARRIIMEYVDSDRPVIL